MSARRRNAPDSRPGLVWLRMILWMATSALASCMVEHHTRPVPHEAVLPWLRAGTTSRAETLAILGPPLRQLEGGRILLWELEDDGYHTPRPREWPWRGPLSLVVVLGSERVERVALVRLWE